QDAARRSGRDPGRVRLLAVTKTATPRTMREAWDAGQTDFAHNYVQRLEEQAPCLPPEACWHAIGPLQRNKVRRAIRVAAVIQTVAEAGLASSLERAAEEEGKAPLAVLAQVNLTPEDGRAGCPPPGLPGLLRHLRSLAAIRCRGLMTLGPQGASDAALHRHFGRLRRLAEESAAAGLLPEEAELSMGMTADFEIAVEEGATMVRIGRALFPPSSQAS
ncbi:MAG: YggS family pyridoxal phosphate-dependent enzyme, partial [Planctomycetota bacterium]